MTVVVRTITAITSTDSVNGPNVPVWLTPTVSFVPGRLFHGPSVREVWSQPTNAPCQYAAFVPRCAPAWTGCGQINSGKACLTTSARLVVARAATANCCGWLVMALWYSSDLSGCQRSSSSRAVLDSVKTSQHRSRFRPETLVGSEPADGNGKPPLSEGPLLDDGLERGTQFLHAADLQLYPSR